MIEISERITRVTTSGDTRTGARLTLEFCRSLPLSSGQAVRIRYDLTGNGGFLDCVGIARHTHVVARRGRLVAFHYRLSHWVSAATLSLLRKGRA